MDWVWMNEQWLGGKNGREQMLKRSMRTTSCKASWISNTCKRMSFEGKDGR
jgi:hypothetical protein